MSVLLFVAFNLYLATATFGDDRGICGECVDYLGNDVPVLMPVMGVTNLIGWLTGVFLGGVGRRVSRPATRARAAASGTG